MSLPCPDDVGKLWESQDVRHLLESVALAGLGQVLLRVVENPKRNSRVEGHGVLVAVVHLHENHRGVLDEMDVEMVALGDRRLFAGATVTAADSDGKREGLVVERDELREVHLLR